MPRFSILMPAYNVENFIEKAVQSCLEQSFKDFELIIVDDASSDNTYKIMQELAKKDERIKIFANESNQKLALTRVAGLKQASGEFVLFLDSDDYYNDNLAFEKIDKRLRESGANLLCFNFENEVFKKKDERIYEVYDDIIYDKKAFLNLIFYTKKTYWNIWTKVVKRELCEAAFKEANVDFNFNMAEDMLLSYFIFKQCLSQDEAKIAGMKDAFYFYKFNSKSTTNTHQVDTNKQAFNYVYNKIIQNGGGQPLALAMAFRTKISSLQFIYNAFKKEHKFLIFYKICNSLTKKFLRLKYKFQRAKLKKEGVI